jgi:hypothetical protein
MQSQRTHHRRRSSSVSVSHVTNWDALATQYKLNHQMNPSFTFFSAADDHQLYWNKINPHEYGELPMQYLVTDKDIIEFLTEMGYEPYADILVSEIADLFRTEQIYFGHICDLLVSQKYGTSLIKKFWKKVNPERFGFLEE